VDQSVSITSTRDGKSGSTTVSEFDDRKLREAVRHTEELATISLLDPEHAPSLAPQKYPEIDNYPETTAAARNEVMIPQIRSIIEAAKSRKLVTAGFFDRSAETAAIANKQGNFGYGRITDSYLSTPSAIPPVRVPAGPRSPQFA
jgi:predicted Zn-dependent protease